MSTPPKAVPRPASRDGSADIDVAHPAPTRSPLGPAASCTMRNSTDDIIRGEDDRLEQGSGLHRGNSAPLLAEHALTGGAPIILGVCALDKKARSKPMRAMLSRLKAFGDFEVVMFGEECIQGEPVERWPICDALIAFFSSGFPLAKAEAYAELRRPFLVNDLHMQNSLLDRRQVYSILERHNIPTPPHRIVNRDAGGNADVEFEEGDDEVCIDGWKLTKPFVEKPVNAEDHNINIYYPHNMGGGTKGLFRKKDDRSAQFHPNENHVRRDGSYIYEAFLQTGGTDIKVYTVGPNYAHAEARKAPAVDGKVQRTAEGKEVRYPVLLSPAEKEIARQVCTSFQQMVCGFDLLRSSNGKSYVCDVNGWSFVKGSAKYDDDASSMVRTIILEAIAPHRLVSGFGRPASSFQRIGSTDHLTPTSSQDGDAESMSPEEESGFHGLEEQRERRESGYHEDLLCVVGILRHADRTPKQKTKVKVRQKEFLDLLVKYRGKKGEAKVKSPTQLQEVLDATEAVLQRAACMSAEDPSEADKHDLEEELDKLRMVQTVLRRRSRASGDHFSGINRKVQLKPTEWDDEGNVVQALLIVKHGGVLTRAGREQSEMLGSNWRNVMYPRYGQLGGGLLRLHSTYRHDLKIYSSEEGRVQMSAAAFAKGMLDLEGESLAPILVSLVTKDQSLLDTFGKGADDEIQLAKLKVYDFLTSNLHDSSLLSAYLSDDGAGGSVGGRGRADSAPPVPLDRTTSSSATSAGLLTDEEEDQSEWLHTPEDADQPEQLLIRLRTQLRSLVDLLKQRVLEAKGHEEKMQPMPGNDETIDLMFNRWNKLHEEFFHKRKQRFDISKIPDIYDMAKYDALHNAHLGIPGMSSLYKAARQVACIVIPNEYGISPKAKLNVGSKICASLLGKVIRDFQYARQQQEAAAKAAREAKNMPTKVSSKVRSSPFLSSSFKGQLGKGAARTPPGSPLKSLAEPEPAKGDQLADVPGEEDEDELPMHQLDTSYASVSRPSTSVRTRLYFTSESHIHSMVNVLRFCHLSEKTGGESLLSEEGQAYLSSTQELDYLSHIVFRMYERLDIPEGHEEKYRIEILFSPGAAAEKLGEEADVDLEGMESDDGSDEDEGHNRMSPSHRSRVLPVTPRERVSPEAVGGSMYGNLTHKRVEQALLPFAGPHNKLDARRNSIVAERSSPSSKDGKGKASRQISLGVEAVSQEAAAAIGGRNGSEGTPGSSSREQASGAIGGLTTAFAAMGQSASPAPPRPPGAAPPPPSPGA